jgi:putative transposase
MDLPKIGTAASYRLGSLRREYLDHMIIHDGRYLQLVVQEYTAYYNQERPHLGIGQRISEQYALSKSRPAHGRIVTRAILGGLHHSYARATNLN